MPRLSFEMRMVGTWILFSATLLLLFLLAANEQRKFSKALAVHAAQASIHKELAFRHWAAAYGGGYVPQDEPIPPNPYLLQIAEHDLETVSGRRLTLTNPAYMPRRVMNDSSGLYGLRARITSLKPLNPDNAPDPWERNALMALENGRESVMEWMDDEASPLLRMMHPLKTSPECLTCHLHQGYRVGEVRGGVGVRVPMGAYLDMERQAIWNLGFSHGFFWLMGSAFLQGYYRVIRLRQREKSGAEQFLREQEKRYWALTDAAPVGVFHVDAEGRCLYVNDQWLGITGQTMEETIGPGWIDAIHPEDRDEILASWQRSMAQGATFKGEWRVKGRNGELRWVLGRAIPQQDDQGRMTGAVGSLTDITSCKRKEESLQQAKERADAASRAKSEFVAHISHEIRTPMNVVLGLSEVLMESGLNDEQRHYVETLHHAGAALLGIINDVLDLSRIEAGRFTLNQIPISPRDVVEETARILQISAEEKGLTLSVEIAAELPEQLLGDDARLRQVLLNLLGNAIKFTPRGEVRVRLIRHPQPPETLWFTVFDTGIGIPPAQREAIFGEFIQADDSITHHYGGSGLGLTISRRLVHWMGGRMWVESEEENGSAFHFTLPVQPVPPSAELAVPAPRVAPRGEPRPLRLLLAEDSPDNQMLFRTYLQKTPHHLTLVNNGMEAFERVKNDPFDLVLMDVQMPILDGYSATLRIRQWERENHRPPLPIIALSAHAWENERERSAEVGCTLYLSKPITKQCLLQTLENCVNPE
ncbi:MAG: DUF3365 domain-containing protein [Magnetococcales bacterium]|nr:DUF3365 domain-containing protein [Magnetococcales bacterium]